MIQIYYNNILLLHIMNLYISMLNLNNVDKTKRAQLMRSFITDLKSGGGITVQ